MTGAYVRPKPSLPPIGRPTMRIKSGFMRPPELDLVVREFSGSSIELVNWLEYHAMDFEPELYPGLRLELEWWNGRKGRRTDGRNRGSGFKHPTHLPVVNANPSPNSDTHGGMATQLAVPRFTEWDVTTRNQTIGINLYSLLWRQEVNYFQAGNGGPNFPNSVSKLMPSWGRIVDNNAVHVNNRFMHSRRAALDLRVRFCYTMPSPTRGRTMVGAFSEEFVIGSKMFPFQMNSQQSSATETVGDIRPGYDWFQAQVWAGSRQTRAL